jgi:hypothetical protein
MKHLVDKRTPANATKLQQFLRIERQAQDALLRAKLRHPEKRSYGNSRVVAFCRIERGQTA